MLRTACCLKTAYGGERALGLVRERVSALFPSDMFAANADRIADPSINQDNPADRPSSHYCAQQLAPKQRAPIEKGRHLSLARQLETRTAPTFRISDSARKAKIEQTGRGKQRCRTPKPRSFHAGGENAI